MSNILHDLITSAYQQSDTTYTEAIKARSRMDDVVDAAPVGNVALYQRACVARELCVQAINAASQARYAIDKLTGEV